MDHFIDEDRQTSFTYSVFPHLLSIYTFFLFSPFNLTLLSLTLVFMCHSIYECVLLFIYIFYMYLDFADMEEKDRSEETKVSNQTSGEKRWRRRNIRG